MKTKTTRYITKLIVAKPFVYTTMYGNTTIRAGRVLETLKNRNHNYHPWPHTIVLGHGDNEVIPVDNLKVKWFAETKTTTAKNGKKTIVITTKEIKVPVPVTVKVKTENRIAKENDVNNDRPSRLDWLMNAR